MKSYSKDRKPSFDRGDREDRGSRDTVMHATTCSTCGIACEVPFRPTGTRPVLCKNCFNSSGSHDSPRRPEDRRFGNKSRPDFKPSFDNRGSDPIKKQLDNIESKLNRILDMISDD